MQSIVPNLWFDNNAEEAVDYYCSVFKNSSKGAVLYYDEVSSETAQMPVGSVLTIEFELNGQEFVALNGGPMFKFTEAVSFAVMCDTQEEVDYYWNALTADGGEESMCGWLKDKFGLSWQITPKKLIEMISSSDKAKAGRAMAAMMQMRKIDIAQVESAYHGS